MFTLANLKDNIGPRGSMLSKFVKMIFNVCLSRDHLQVLPVSVCDLLTWKNCVRLC